jgi:3-deoxy-D-manno-octulosonic acid kinase
MNPVRYSTAEAEYLFAAEKITSDQMPFEAPQSYQLKPVSKGRGEAWFVTPVGDAAPTMVWRHFRRGGLIGRLVRDKYWWTGLEKTRAWREWNITAQLAEEGFPVPTAVAARVQRRSFFYTADLITGCLQNVRTLSEVLEDEPISDDLWEQLGSLVARFHDRGVWHADLNAHNIMLQATAGADVPVLIDFDRAEFREQNPNWRESNLSRLRRSFDKLKGLNPSFNFSEENWAALMSGYLP